MALLRPSPSKRIWNAYKDGLAEMIELDRSPTGLPEGLPQPIYVLQPSEIAAGKDLSAAKHSAWRFYRGTFAGPAIAVEVGRTAHGRQPRMTSLSDGHGVQVTFHQVSLIEQLHPVRVADYELRRLKIPGTLTAYWLKSHLEDKDLVVIIAGSVRGLKSMRPYPAKKFLSTLRPITQARLRSTDEPGK